MSEDEVYYRSSQPHPGTSLHVDKDCGCLNTHHELEEVHREPEPGELCRICREVSPYELIGASQETGGAP